MTYPAQPPAPHADLPAESGELEAQPDSGALTDEDVQAAMSAMVTDARAYMEEKLTPEREAATERYQGRPLGNEEEGRSQYVATVTRDTIGAFMPSLMRVFWGSDRAAEFAPNRPDMVEQAEQATEYICDVVMSQDNPGYQITHDAFLDGLLHKQGVFKWWHEAAPKQSYAAVGLTPAEVGLLEQDPEIAIERASESALATPGDPRFDIEYTQTRGEGVSRFAALPPEEFLRSRDARSLKDAQFVGHQTHKTRGELIAMGVPADVLDEHGHEDTKVSESPEEQARRGGDIQKRIETPDKSGDLILFIEGFPYLAMDGENRELRRVTMVGPAFHVVTNEPWDERPFGYLCPFPEPHTMDGQSLADRTMDLDRIESMIVRSMLDSLALSIHPRIGFVEGEVTLQDVMNPEIGAPIRMRSPNALQPIEHTFVGQAAFPVLEYTQQVRENRTGQTKAAQGLDPDTLQSSTRTGVAATLAAAQQHIEIVARTFAETGFKDLMRGLLRLEVAYPKRKRMVRLRGKYVEVDPRAWDANMDVRVNVALGSGLVEQKVALLAAIAQKQEMVLQTMGPSNPLVTLKQYRDTLVKGIRAAGRRDADVFFQDVDPNWQPPPPQPAPDPNMIIAQAEMERAKADIAKKAAEVEQEKADFQAESLKKMADIELAREKMHMDDDRLRDEAEAKLLLEVKKLELEHQTTIDITHINAAMQRDRERIKAVATVAAASKKSNSEGAQP